MKKITVAEIHADFKSAVNMMVTKSETLNKLKEAGFSKKVEVNNHLSDVLIKYPNHKMIYDDQVKILCKKYSLVRADIDRYIGYIPEKNLNEILEFKKRLKYIVIWDSFCLRLYGPHLKSRFKIFSSREEAESFNRKKQGRIHEDHKFYIICPAKDLHLEKGEKIKNDEIVVEDPIVLAKPIWNDEWFIHNEYNIIVTAWGDEAQDENVFNVRLN